MDVTIEGMAWRLAMRRGDAYSVVLEASYVLPHVDVRAVVLTEALYDTVCLVLVLQQIVLLLVLLCVRTSRLVVGVVVLLYVVHGAGDLSAT